MFGVACWVGYILFTFSVSLALTSGSSGAWLSNFYKVFAFLALEYPLRIQFWHSLSSILSFVSVDPAPGYARVFETFTNFYGYLEGQGRYVCMYVCMYIYRSVFYLGNYCFRFQIVSWISVYLFLCFSAFLLPCFFASLLSLLLCFSAFLLICCSASPLFCFAAFPAFSIVNRPQNNPTKTKIALSKP